MLLELGDNRGVLNHYWVALIKLGVDSLNNSVGFIIGIDDAGACSRPFCRSPILTVIVPSLGASMIPLDSYNYYVYHSAMKDKDGGQGFQ